MDTDSDLNYEKYLDLLKKHSGFFTLGMKIPVRDAQALALVYTPGVAANCLEIQKNLGDAFKYTNKLNTMIIVCDSSGLPGYDSSNWNNMEPIPYLEAMCVLYKVYANIDCYPFVFDHRLTPDGKTLAETIKPLMQAYSLVEFFGVDPKRLDDYDQHIGKHHDFATLTLQGKRELEQAIHKNGYLININLIWASVIRTALDSQAYHNLDQVVQYLIKEINDKNVPHTTNDHYAFMEELISRAGNYILTNNLSTQTTNEYNLNQEKLSLKYLTSKYRRFILEGERSWVDVFPDNFFTKDGTNNENSLLFHYRYKGFVSTKTTLAFKNPLSLDRLLSWSNLDKLSQLFHSDPQKSEVYSCRGNLGAIITNGTAILGLGDIGALAGLPVMEGKSILFKLFGGTNIVPVCVQEKDVKKLIEICERISPIFCCINLEDIKAPECFEIEETLIERIPYPVFHDDQHGTAIVVLAGLINAFKLSGKSPGTAKVVMNGAGAAGLSVTQLLIHYGIKNFIICDTSGAIYTGRPNNMNPFKEKLAQLTNQDKVSGSLEEVIKGADVFVGLSAAGALKKEWVATMAPKPIIFALANPIPEIMPDEAKAAGAFIIATGRSDFHNQVNNSLAFPGLFRAAIDVRSRKISIEMKEAASLAIASLVPNDSLSPEMIIPSGLDPQVPIGVTNAVAHKAIEQGLAQDQRMNGDRVQENIMIWNLEDHILNWDDIEEHKLKWDFKMK